MKTVLSLTIAFFVWTGLVRAEVLPEPGRFLIPRDQLATQESDPFMLAGRLMDESQPRWRAFEGTLAAFPDTSSCLLSEERGKDVQNLLAFDWKAMRTLTEIDICVWRIATTLDDIGLMRHWLAAQGFSGSYNTQSCDNAVRATNARDSHDFCGIDGAMSIEDLDARTSVYTSMSFLTRWFWRGVSRKASLTVRYDYYLSVRDVSFGIISE